MKHDARTVNAGGLTTQAFTRTLQFLTGRRDLLFLTLNHWFGGFRRQSPVREHKAWCPHCYQDASSANRIVADHLSWNLRDVNLCSVHHSPLVELCPHCNHQPLWLQAIALPGFCPFCFKWLGQSRTATPALSDPANYEYELWVASSVGEVLAAPDAVTPSPREQLIEKVKRSMARRPTAYARLLGTSSDAARYWHKKDGLPSLRVVLKLCYVSGIPLVDFIDAGVPPTELRFPDISGPVVRTQLYSRVNFNTSKLRALAETALCEYPPMSLAAVAKRINKKCTVSARIKALRKLVPDLSRHIINRYRRYAQRMYHERQQRLRRIAQHKDGPPPCISDVCELLRVSRAALWRLCPKSYREIKNRYQRHEKNVRRAKKTAIEQNIRNIAYSLHRQGIYPSGSKVLDLVGSSRWHVKDGLVVLRNIRIELGYPIV